MAKVFDWKAGSLIDKVSGNLLTNNGVVFKQTEKGMAGYFDNGNSLTLTGLNLNVINFLSNVKGIGTLRIAVGANNTDIILTDNLWKQVKNTVSYTSETSITISCISGNIYLQVITLFDTTLTTQEINNEYKDFLNSQPLATTKFNFDYSSLKPTDLSNEDGLIAAYNFKDVTDISSKGHNGTNIGHPLRTNEGIKYNGVDDKTSFGDIGNVKSVAFRIKLNSDTETILEGAANDKLIYASSGTLSYPDFDSAYVNGVTSNIIVEGLWLNVFITSSTDVNMSVLTLALNNTSCGKFEIAYLRFYTTEKDINFIRNYHNQYAKQVTFIDNFIYEPADGTNIVPQDWIAGTGDYKISELIADDVVLPHLKKGTKMLECVNTGTIAFPSKQVYGTWEFDVSSSSLIVCYFINNNIDINNGYAITLETNRYYTITLSKVVSGVHNILFKTANNYISANVNYRIKITSSLIGKFTVYIKGGTFGDNYVLVYVIGGSGTNPVTSATYKVSNFTILSLYPGSQVTNIKYTKGIEQ